MWGAGFLAPFYRILLLIRLYGLSHSDQTKVGDNKMADEMKAGKKCKKGGKEKFNVKSVLEMRNRRNLSLFGLI